MQARWILWLQAYLFVELEEERKYENTLVVTRLGASLTDKCMQLLTEVSDCNKSYEGVMRLGQTTPSLDADTPCEQEPVDCSALTDKGTAACMRCGGLC